MFSYCVLHDGVTSAASAASGVFADQQISSYFIKLHTNNIVQPTAAASQSLVLLHAGRNSAICSSYALQLHTHNKEYLLLHLQLSVLVQTSRHQAMYSS